MITLSLIQGSPEWKAARREYFTASEASIMMGASNHVSRNELLRMKATGSEQEFSEWFEKNVLDKGHQVEAAARPLIELSLGDELFPVTAEPDEQPEGLRLLASFDGVTMLEDTTWECKQLNKDKLDAVERGFIPACDYWQVIQQLYISKADHCIYTVTDGTEEQTRSVTINAIEHTDSFSKLIAGWKQFKADLDAYTPKETLPQLAGEKIQELPALFVDIVGEVRNTNLMTVKDVILARIGSVNTDLQTDQDFADAEEAVKFFTKAEKQLEQVKEQALAKTTSIDDLFKTVDHLKDAMRNKRLALNKLVKERKEQIRTDVVLSAQASLFEHINTLNSKLSGAQIPAIAANFAEAIKGKKTITSLRSSADDALAAYKVEANQWFDKITANFALYDAAGGNEHSFLFRDLNTLILKDADDLTAAVKSRIAEHKEAEAQRLEDERARIRAQEEAKARMEAEAKLRAEQEAKVTDSFANGADYVNNQEWSKSSLGEHHFKMPEPVKSPGVITISIAEYHTLKADSALLQALEAAGVSEWAGYQQAVNNAEKAA